MRSTISNVFLRLERQTTTLNDRFSLFLMIFRINIKISVYRRHTYMGYYAKAAKPNPNSLFGGKKTKKNLKWFFIETKFAFIYQLFRQ